MLLRQIHQIAILLIKYTQLASKQERRIKIYTQRVLYKNDPFRNALRSVSQY